MLFTFLLLNLCLAYSLRVPIATTYSKKSPLRVNIFDKELVVWWNNDKWCATNDMCLHRQASLSKGVITKDGNIKCGYHGWEYNNCGKCVYIPSSDEQMDLSNGKYDIEEKNGMLWFVDNSQHDNDNIFDNVFNDYIFTRWTYKELPGSNQLYLENTMDLLHFNHVHDSTPPPVSRYKEMEIIKNNESIVHWFNETGFSVEVIENKAKSRHVFIAPYTLLFTLGESVSICAVIYPTDTDNCKFYSSFLLPKQTNEMKNKISKVSYNVFKPLIDSYGNFIFNQDTEQVIEQHNHIKKYGKKYISPYVGDKPIMLYNKWLKKYYNETV